MKTSEISIENSKRVVLSDNNSSSSSTVIEKSKEKLTESNGMVQNCERYSDKECVVENSGTPDDDKSENSVRPKSSASCNDLLMFCQTKRPDIEPAEQSLSHLAIKGDNNPYNIINNYFSGLYTQRENENRALKEDFVYARKETF